MIKNKLLLFSLLLTFSLHAAITKEDFLAMADEKKWDLYVGHNACYQRIFRNKDAAIIALEDKANWWRNIAIGTSCYAVGALLISGAIISRKVFARE